MPILDNITKIAKTVGDKTANVANNVAKKSGELVEITKLNSSISAEENKIRDTFTEIGKMIYDRFEKNENDTNDTEILNLCNSIITMKNNIAAYKDKISELKGIKACPNCKTDIEKDMRYCPECGNKQEMPIEEQQAIILDEDQHIDNNTEASEHNTECGCNCGCNTEENKTE